MKFKPGDKVKCIDNRPNKFGFKSNLVIGKIYTVHETTLNSNQKNSIRLENDLSRIWIESRFELYSDDSMISSNIDYLSITKEIVGG